MLLIFEFAFVIAWWSPNNTLDFTFTKGDFSGFISYFTISALVIPIGTACTSAIMQGALIPTKISTGRNNRKKKNIEIEIDIDNEDEIGGLSPLVELSIHAGIILSIGIGLSVILHTPLYMLENNRLLFFGSYYIGIGIIIFILPFIYNQKILKQQKQTKLNNEYKSKDKIKKEIEITFINLEKYLSKMSNNRTNKTNAFDFYELIYKFFNLHVKLHLVEDNISKIEKIHEWPLTKKIRRLMRIGLGIYSFMAFIQFIGIQFNLVKMSTEFWKDIEPILT